MRISCGLFWGFAVHAPMKKLPHASDRTAVCVAWIMPSRHEALGPVPVHSLHICIKMCRQSRGAGFYGDMSNARHHKLNLAVLPARQ